MRAMPFGASAAVRYFNRASQAILLNVFGVPCAHYFDAFTCFAPEVICDSVTRVAERALKILGWDINEAKEEPWAPEFTAFGVSFDLSASLDVESRCSRFAMRPRGLRAWLKTLPGSWWPTGCLRPKLRSLGEDWSLQTPRYLGGRVPWLVAE